MKNIEKIKLLIKSQQKTIEAIEHIYEGIEQLTELKDLFREINLNKIHIDEILNSQHKQVDRLFNSLENINKELTTLLINN